MIEDGQHTISAMYIYVYVCLLIYTFIYAVVHEMIGPLAKQLQPSPPLNGILESFFLYIHTHAHKPKAINGTQNPLRLYIMDPLNLVSQRLSREPFFSPAIHRRASGPPLSSSLKEEIR